MGLPNICAWRSNGSARLSPTVTSLPLARQFAGLAIALLGGACARSSEPETTVMVLGVDGFEWSVILPLVAEGRMPHLASLVERGVSGVLESQLPAARLRPRHVGPTARDPG